MDIALQAKEDEERAVSADSEAMHEPAANGNQQNGEANNKATTTTGKQITGNTIEKKQVVAAEADKKPVNGNDTEKKQVVAAEADKKQINGDADKKQEKKVVAPTTAPMTSAALVPKAKAVPKIAPASAEKKKEDEKAASEMIPDALISSLHIMQPIIKKSLEQLAKEGSKYPRITASTQEALTLNKKVEDKLAKITVREFNKYAVVVIRCILTAFEPKQAKLMNLSLDLIQKLMAYGFVRSSTIDDTQNPPKRLIDVIVDTINLYFEFDDDVVQRNIIKVMLTAVSSVECGVHDHTLMNAIRTCYNIYLISKNPIAQQAVKGPLTQMISTVFQRMEDAYRELGVVTAEDIRVISEKASGAPSVPRTSEDAKAVSAAVAGAIAADKSSAAAQVASTASNASAASTGSPTPPLASSVTPGEPTSRVASPKSEDLITDSRRSSSSMDDGRTQTSYQHPAINDAFLILRALCKLSMKELPEGTLPDTSHDLRSKVLSLELISGIVDQCALGLPKDHKFIANVIKRYLCISLLINGCSTFPRVFMTTMSIFSTLVFKYKDLLKSDIEVFFNNIILVILESPSSTTLQKLMVIQVLEKVCKNPQTLIDIFLNYDCDLRSRNIFESMVNALSSISKEKVSSNQVVTAQEAATKALALECLVTIMQSLVDWSKELAETKEEKEEEPTEDKDLSVPDEVWDAPVAPLETTRQHIPDKFEINKQAKSQLEHAKLLFAIKPKRAIRWLMENGIVQNTPESVAQWIATHAASLDKTLLGDYFGDPDKFAISVFYAYVDNHCNFPGFTIDKAVRNFLAVFRLPGEAPKIDRIILKFAEKYFNDNNVKTARMTKADWIKNNRLCPDLKTIPDETFNEIYDRILAHPIDLNSTNRLGRDAQLFNKDAKQVYSKLQEIMKNQNQKGRETFIQSRHIEHVRPMFEISWWAMIASFSVILEDSEDDHLIDLCLQGFKCGIRVSSTFHMAMERNAFVTSLSNFTVMNNLREVKRKHIDAMKALIHVALTDGNFLEESWTKVLKCISQLERMHLIGLGAKPDTTLLPPPEETSPATVKNRARQQKIAQPVAAPALKQYPIRR